ncbi:hypothetical protein LPJ64_000349 [Coemansia asiatica]|uniref:Uncharacterized protein n=1 Tax=Coemansia asiatica TaxID=1052880 RepID=A0A9W8CLN1_9FUNG|nr:hypothetical protein LPJ64_000349 [Coemansia asiatica]
MKSIQFALAASVALFAVVSAQGANTQHEESAPSVSAAGPKASSSISAAVKPVGKDEKPKPKDAADKKVHVTNNLDSAGKQTKDAKDAKDMKNAKQAKVPAPDANAASHQLAISGALVGAAAIVAAYI